MARKKTVKETHEEIAVVDERIRNDGEIHTAQGRYYTEEEPEPNRARTICDADIIIGLLEMDSAVKKIDELNLRIDNIIDAHEHCQKLKGL